MQYKFKIDQFKKKIKISCEQQSKKKLCDSLTDFFNIKEDVYYISNKSILNLLIMNLDNI